MKKSLILTLSLLSTCVWADGPADEVKAAAKKLAEAPNYSWTTTTKVPEDSQFKPGPAEGKTQKDGLSWTSYSFGERKMESLIKDGKALTKVENEWKTSEELRAASGGGGNGGNGGGRRGGFGGLARAFKTPAAQSEDLAGKVKELKKDGDALAGDISEAGVKELLTMGGRRPNADGQAPPEPTGAKGSVKFWLKDGSLSKVEVHVEGTVKFGENERKIDRTTTTEIKDVGSTKLDISDDVKKKLADAPAPPAPGATVAPKPAEEKK